MPEPFDPLRHDRTAFSSGVAAVDNCFKKTANKLSRADNLRVFVMTHEDDGVIGFYALNAHAIDYAELPEKFACNRPGHGSIPAVFIAMIGRDVRFKSPFEDAAAEGRRGILRGGGGAKAASPAMLEASWRADDKARARKTRRTDLKHPQTGSQGGGYGGDLLADGLARIARIADELGVAVAVLNVLDCGDAERTARRRALYLDYGFQPFPSNPMRLFLPVATIRRLMDER